MMNYRDGHRLGVRLASLAVVMMGTLVAVNAQGYGVPANSPDAVKLMGMALHDADNSQGVDGAVTVTIGRNQQYLLRVDADKPLTQADVGKTALLTPNHTIVASGDGLLQIGEIMSIEPDGYAWVEIGFGNTSKVTPSNVNVLTFSQLINATYDGKQLNGTNSYLAEIDDIGYKATIDNPTNIEFVLTGITGHTQEFYIGNSDDTLLYNQLPRAGAHLVFSSSGGAVNVQFSDNTATSIMHVSNGDVVRLMINNGYLTITNVTANNSWQSPNLAEFDNPKYMVVLHSSDNIALPIKAI